MNKKILISKQLLILFLCCLSRSAVADDCLDKMYQTDMNLCAIEEWHQTTAQLDKVYNQLMAKISPEGQAKLRAILRPR